MHRAWFAFGVAILAVSVSPGPAPAASPRARAMRMIETGHPAAAAALLDSLLAADPTDASAAYWAARVEEEAGRDAPAICRYLALEGAVPGTPEATLATWRRQALERRSADALVARGPDRADPDRTGRGAVLLLPPENVSAPEDAPLFGLTWTYLLQEAMRGSEICPVPIPVMLAATDLVRDGRPIRAPAAATTAPVNTVEGLRARLSVLSGADGELYLRRPDGGWSEDLEAALVRFQRDQSLPPTGEADLGTQARLDEQLLVWLQQTPRPVDPKLVPRIAELCGATVVVRGTWRREEGRIALELAPLDPLGGARLGEPVSASFPIEQASTAAREAASRLVRRLGGSGLDVAAGWSLTSAEYELATATLLLLDRGLSRPVRERWARAPLSLFAWPALASARAAAEFGTERAIAAERMLRDAWLRAPGLEARAALDQMMEGLGLPVQADVGAQGVPSPWRVIGNEGILQIHGEWE